MLHLVCPPRTSNQGLLLQPLVGDGPAVAVLRIAENAYQFVIVHPELRVPIVAHSVGVLRDQGGAGNCRPGYRVRSTGRYLPCRDGYTRR